MTGAVEDVAGCGGVGIPMEEDFPGISMRWSVRVVECGDVVQEKGGVGWSCGSSVEGGWWARVSVMRLVRQS